MCSKLIHILHLRNVDLHFICADVEIIHKEWKKMFGLFSLSLPVVKTNKFRVAMVKEKYLENEIFSRSGKSQGIFFDVQGNLERTWKVREKSGNLKINGYGMQCLANSFL